MDDSDVKQKPVYSSKKRFHHKKKWIIGIVIATVIVAVGAILAIAYLLPKTPSTKGGDITIGATTITQQQLNDYAKSIEDYRTADPEFALDGDAKVIASDDLIMNAALKYYAVKYGQTVSNKEVLAEAFIEVTSDQEADSVIGTALGDVLSLPRIRNENVAYQRKLADYVLAMKSLFVMRTSFDMPYFLYLPAGEIQAAYDSAIAKLRNEILPLFNAKQSKEDIAIKADVNLMDDDTTDDQEPTQYYNGSIIMASLDKDFRADGKYYNNIDDTASYTHGDVGQLFSMDEKIATLKNVGDFTDVFSSKTGEFVIVRLESKTDGEFNSWQEMLESFKKQYAYDSISKVISDVSYGMQVFVENTAKAIASIGVDKASAVSAAYCAQHIIVYNYSSYSAGTQTRIGGTTVRFDGQGIPQPGYLGGGSCPNGTQHTQVITSSSGYVSIPYSCTSYAPVQQILGHPGGLVFKGMRSPYPISSDSSNYNGWVNWSSGWINGVVNAYTNFMYGREWHIGLGVNVTKASVTPGDTIEWNHTVRNDGPESTDRGVDYGYYDSSGFDEAKSVSTGNLPLGSVVGASQQFSSLHEITQNNVGKNLCRATYANPGDWNTGFKASPPACVYIPYNYTLTPFITSDVSEAIEANTIFSVIPSTTNKGPTRSSSTRWQITEIVVDPGNTVPNPKGGASDQSPCGTYFQGANSTCGPIASNVSGSSGTTVFSETGAWLSGSKVAATAVTSGDYEVGTHICYAFSVQPQASFGPVDVDVPGVDGNLWAHSAPVCLVISKKPKAQIWGGDLSTIGLVQTSTSTKAANGGRTFGSWVEYGMFATGSITGMASGSAFAGSGLQNATVCSFSTLSFTNAGDSACGIDTKKGYYATTGSIADIANSFPGDGTPIPADTEVKPNELPVGSSGVFVGSTTGNLTLGTSILDQGKSIILKVSGTVTIAGDQMYYDGPYNAISQLPQLIIIADKIIINSDVTRVDAWLIANGANGILETCNTGSSTYELTGDQRLTINKCKDKLTVNGPVMAKQLWLRRTYGSGIGEASGIPAEIFNLRADAYLWSIARATSSGHVQTVYTTELPPRF